MKSGSSLRGRVIEEGETDLLVELGPGRRARIPIADILDIRRAAHPREACEACRGTLRIPCGTCQGRRRLRGPDCIACRTSGILPCPDCEGGALLDCPFCEDGRRRCERCAGAGSVAGRVCLGCLKGTVGCGACGRDPGMPPGRIRCGRCGGNGRIACALCGGRGRRDVPCLACDLRGVVPCPKDGGAVLPLPPPALDLSEAIGLAAVAQTADEMRRSGVLPESEWRDRKAAIRFHLERRRLEMRAFEGAIPPDELASRITALETARAAGSADGLEEALLEVRRAKAAAESEIASAATAKAPASDPKKPAAEARTPPTDPKSAGPVPKGAPDSSPPPPPSACKATTKSGAPCSRRAGPGGTCWQHAASDAKKTP